MSAQRERHVSAVSEAGIVLALFFALALAGWAYLSVYVGVPCHDFNNPLGEEFAPAVFWATGHGMSEAYPNPYPAPGLRAFLMKEQMTWDPSGLSPDIATAPVSWKFHLDRLYLLYAVGITWWLLGFSWPALNVLVAVFYALTGVLAYGIFRLGANRALSVAGALLFLLSPLVLFYVPSMRDFFRGPPILATLLFCGYVSSRGSRRGPFLLLSLALGLAIGFGTGLRQDAIICLPPAVVTLLLFARVRKPYPIATRMLAVLLLLVGFYVPARPVLASTQDTGGNNAFYLLQGFSTMSLEGLHARNASCSPIYSHSDFLVHGLISAYEDATEGGRRADRNRGAHQLKAAFALQGVSVLPLRPVHALLPLALGLSTRIVYDRGLDMWSREAEEVGRRMVFDIGRTFPADVIAKWYSAAIVSLRGAARGDFNRHRAPAADPMVATLARFEHPLEAHLRRWGAWYGVAALLAIGAANLRLALAIAFLWLYFSGYTGIAYHPRHALHLQWVTLWAPAFLASALLHALCRLRDPAFRQALPERFRNAGPGLRKALARVTALCLIGLVALGVPLLAARAWQYYQVRALVERYAAARLEPLALEYREDPRAPIRGEDAMVAPVEVPGLACPSDADRGGLLHLPPVSPVPCFGIRVAYLAAEIETPEPVIALNLRYSDERPVFDLYERYRAKPGVPPGKHTFFFPVFEMSRDYQSQYPAEVFASFFGVVPDYPARVTNMYRVRNQADFPILMNVWLPEDPAAFQWYIGVTPLGPSGLD